MAKKYFFFLSFAILLFLISFISAGFFSDFAGKITGQQVACEIPGEYNLASYCGFDEAIHAKKISGDFCSNNYECEINSCVEGVCKSQFEEIPEQTTFLEDILNDFLEFLGIVEARECNLGDTKPCGTNEGICEFGTQGCTPDFVWESTCGGTYIGPEVEAGFCKDDLDNDCDGYTDGDDKIPDADGNIDCEACDTYGATKSCGTNVGICEFGSQTCSADNFWGVCGGDNYIGPRVEANFCTDDLDNDCDGDTDDEDLDCQICDGTVTIVDCSGLDTAGCDAQIGCEGGSQCISECSTLNGNELGCRSVGCDWKGPIEIICGNNKIDPVLNEICDGSDLNGLNCVDPGFGSDFTGGALSCDLDCNNFDVSLCTVSYSPDDVSINKTLNGINGLTVGTTVTVELLDSLPQDVSLPSRTNLFSILNINVDIPPPATAEILFAVNKTNITISENAVGLYRVESDSDLANLQTTLIDTSGAYYNYSAITDHFSVFLIVESLAICGDGFIDPGEECDRDDNLNGKSCTSTSIGYDAGILACTDSCLFNVSSCSLDGNGGDDSDINTSIRIVTFSPKGGITYGKMTIPLKVVDVEGNAGFWRYILNGGAITVFSPNTTINVRLGINVLKIFARKTQASSYEAFNLVSFRVVNNPDASCGDNICGVSENCGSCANDCGSCALVGSYCGDNICGLGENSLNCPNDCEEEKKSRTGFFILLTFVILVAIVIVVFFIFKKMKGSRSPSISPIPPPTTAGPAGPSFSRPRRPPLVKREPVSAYSPRQSVKISKTKY